MRGWTAVLVLGALLAWTSRVSAQADTPPRDGGFIGKDMLVLEIDDCPAPAQVDSETLRRRGSEHFQRGEVLYVQGDYKGAVKELVAAYCIAPFYIILKDIGQAYERELDYERAIAYFERYVMAVPRDAKAARSCDSDPQDDKRNVIARIKTLQQLRAKVRVNTEPGDAQITLVSETGQKSTGVSGQEIEVLGGLYQVIIERAGYHTVRQEVPAKIGKPYTLFAKLEPRKGRLRVRAVPANARLFLDQRQVGTGAYEAELPAGRYTVMAEAQGRITTTQTIELLADRDTPLALDLPAQPQVGRRQFIAYSTIAGGVAAGTLLGASDEGNLIASASVIGLAGGLFGSYFLAPRDIPLGTSSLAITSSLIGGTAAGYMASVFTADAVRISPAIGAGLVLGGATGYIAGERLDISPGDAAVINSGAVWGTVIGLTFSRSFEATSERKIGGGLVLSGLGIGTLSGILLARNFDVSRSRAALIDLGGLLGAFVGIAIDNVVAQNANDTANAERTANYTLGGIATGLVLTGVLTRNMDAPKLGGVSPVISKAQSGTQATTTFGLGGTF